ncbi:hypothetical protein DEO72_LG1g3333 [Vigna unguiculata]|uniref:Uncharacterized protein n=1 Tax=Vigna unguiculata TaxID=3917 RepID=A0A4D6KNL2_VIGUN|nr:hypothetical protein DEO72_LG1g3333 [Vigna unguiculata]
MKIEKLSVADKEVVETLMKFNDRLPTKGLVRVYNLVHPVVDIEGHMAQLGKKNLKLFQTLRKEKVAKAKAVGSTEVPNLQESLAEVNIHGGTKRKAELPTRYDGGKDLKKLRVALLGSGSSSGAMKPEVGLIELPETIIRKDIKINLSERNAMVKVVVEFSSKALILGRRVGSMIQREFNDGSRSKVEELQSQVDKHAEEKAVWEKEKMEWLEERKRLGTWKVRCLDSEKTLKGRVAELEADYEELKEKHDSLELELEDLKGCIIQEHINGF